MAHALGARFALLLTVALVFAGPTVAQGSAGAGDAFPPGLQPILLQAMARDAGPAYHVRDDGCATLRRPALRACFRADGVVFDGADAPTTSLRLASVGRTGSARPLVPVAPRVDGSRVEYAHPMVTEWWQVLPVGFEQGFTFDTRPPGAGALALELHAGGRGTAHGGAIGWGPLRYGALVVTDAGGRVVPSTMEVRDEAILIAVNDDGAAYPLTVDPLVWVEQRVTASDGGGQFGWSVAIDGSSAMVGAKLTDVGPNVNQGAAYVFTEVDGVWSETQILTAPDGAEEDAFGYSVSIDGSTAIVGAAYADGGRGAAYVFTRTGITWSLQQKVFPAAGPTGTEFGLAVDVDGDHAVVGAQYAAGQSGAAYVFARAGGVWTEQSILTASDGAQFDQFGITVALSGDYALVGAQSAAVGDSVGQGAAYLFQNVVGTWSQVQKLTASDGTAGDGFGNSVALVGPTALVGAYTASVGSQDLRGAAYVYSGAAPPWVETQKLTASNGQNNDYFGVSVALADTTALIGSLYGATDYQGGTAYVFHRSGASWVEASMLAPNGGHTDDAFSNAVAVDDGRALVGAYPGGEAHFFMATAPPDAVVSTNSISVGVASGGVTTTSFSLANEAGPEAADLTFSISTGEAPAGNARLVETGLRRPALTRGETGMSPAAAPAGAAYVAFEGGPYAIWRGEQVTLTHSLSQTIVSGAGIACNTEGEGTAENSWWRVFDLDDFDLASLDVTSVDVAIEIASITGSHDAGVRLYRLDGVFNTGNLTLIGEATFALASTSGQIVNVPVAGSFAAHEVLVVEWFVPDLRPTMGTLFPGANSAGETGPGYLSSFSCKILQPTPLALMGFPESHMVMNVHGTGTPALVVASPTSGAVAPGASQEITLTINATATPPGDYAYQALVETNDPDALLIEVAVTVNVGPVGTEEGGPPASYVLHQARPSPASGPTSIAYELPEAGDVRLGVYDAVGRLVATLVEGERPAGMHEVTWDATGAAGGVYFVRLDAGDVRRNASVVVVR